MDVDVVVDNDLDVDVDNDDSDNDDEGKDANDVDDINVHGDSISYPFLAQTHLLGKQRASMSWAMSMSTRMSMSAPTLST